MVNLLTAKLTGVDAFPAMKRTRHARPKIAPRSLAEILALSAGHHSTSWNFATFLGDLRQSIERGQLAHYALFRRRCKTIS
jgi:hypothetical protein